MRFSKENQPAKRGRPKGSKDKVKVATKEILGQAIDGYMPNLAEDLQVLKPAQRVQAVTNLLKYILPTLKQSEVSQTMENVSWLNLDMNTRLKLIDEIYPDEIHPDK